MKKFFFLGLSLLLSVCGFAEGYTFHSPGAKYAGTPFEYVNISNALTNEAPKEGVNKYGINDAYPWIVYTNSGSILDNGQGEVSRGGYYVSYNPVSFASEFVYMVDDAQKWLGSPKVELGWVKGETYLDRIVSKYITLCIKDATRLDLLLTGAGSNTNIADIVVKDAADNSVVQTITTEAMPGKSNKDAASNTASQIVAIKGLDATKSYIIIIAPSASATQVEVAGVDEDGDPVKGYKSFAEVCGADANLLADVDVTGKSVLSVKSPAVAVTALHIYGTDMTVETPVAPAPNNGGFHAATSLYPRAPFEYVNISNALRNDAPKTTYNAEGDPATANKYAINDKYPWIYYNYTGSVLDNGLCEVSRGGIYVSKNPVTVADEFVYMADDAQLWLGTPKVEVGYTKNADATFNILPKTITFNVKDTKRVDLLLTGGGSNINKADIFVINAADNTVVKTITTEEMPGKSNKASEANTKSQYVTVDGLDEALSYYITVTPAVSAFQVETTTIDEDGDPVKAWVPFTGAENLLNDIPNQAISNVKGSAVYVAALRIFSKDGVVGDMIAPAAPAEAFFTPVGRKLAGAAFAYTNLSNALRNDAPLTTFNAEGVATVGSKYAINDSYPWIFYNYTGSVLDNGMMEAARGGYYFSKNPVTGADEVVYMTDDAGLWLGSPKIEIGWAKGETYFKKLMPKTIQFSVKEATKVDFLLTGAGSNTNVADIKVINAADNSVVKTITTEAMAGKSNKNDGSQSNSQFVAIDELDPALSYTIIIAPSASATQIEVTGVDEDGDPAKTYKPMADVLGAEANLFADVTVDESLCVSNIKSPAVAIGSIRVWGTDVTEDKTLEGIIATAKANHKSGVSLSPYIAYELKAAADANGMTIKGNGATVTASADGKIVTKGDGLTIDNLVLNAAAVTSAPIALANKDNITDEETEAYRSWIPATPAVLYTYEEYKALEGKAEVTEEEFNALPEADKTKVPATEKTMKYAGAANDVLIAEPINIKNSTIRTGGSFISGGNAAWALKALNVENTVVGTTAGTGKAFINWEEGASQIKDIVIKKSTLFSTDAASQQRFHRYSTQVDPWRVWGYEGDNKNAPGLNTWTLEENTIVNLCADKEFSNNIKNTAATTFVFTKNVFVNTWRIQKLGSNVTRDFDYTTNAIAGGKNPVDGTDASKWAVEDTDMGIAYEGIDHNYDFHPATYSYAAKVGAGDPRWAVTFDPGLELSERVKAGVKVLNLNPEYTYTLNAPAIADALNVVTINAKGATIKVGAEGQFVAQAGIIINDAIIDASESPLAPVALSATPDASLYTYTPAEGETPESYKYEGANQKVYESETVQYNNCTVITAAPLFNAGTAAWALKDLTVNNTIVEVKYKSGKAIIDVEEGANSIKDITVKNSTIYADDAATDMRFIRYTNASNAQAQKVWGTTGTSSFTIENSTFVNVCGNKEFANNYVNKNNTTLTWKNNIFTNVWRINKIGANNVRNFAQEDNFITGGVNAVDGTDANWATPQPDLGIVWNYGEEVAAPAATDVATLGAYFGVYEFAKEMGDPRWAEYVKATPSGIDNVTVESADASVMKLATKNGIVIVKDGQIFNVAGSMIK